MGDGVSNPDKQWKPDSLVYIEHEVGGYKLPKTKRISAGFVLKVKDNVLWLYQSKTQPGLNGCNISRAGLESIRLNRILSKKEIMV